MNEVTRIRSAIEKGDSHAAEQLLPLVYDELRKLAAQRLAQENPGQTLQATALVHEAYLRLVGGDDRQPWDNRGHFFAAAAEAMRRILIETARRKKRIRHGGAREQVELAEAHLLVEQPVEDLLAIDEVLEQLAEIDTQAADLVKLRIFAGMTTEEAAAALDVPERTAFWHIRPPTLARPRSEPESTARRTTAQRKWERNLKS
jgi:RNA polymerase sigma factor (TIGR02999 family)